MLGVLSLLILTDCSRSDIPPLGQVSGKVTSKGKPVFDGVVTFMSENGFGVSAPLNGEGGYALRSQYGLGIPIGSYKVTVTPPLVPASDVATPAERPAVRTALEIPKKYREFATSGFEFKIESGSQKLDLDLVP